MCDLKKILVMVFAICFAISAQASVTEMQCPANIDVTEKLIKLPDGFENMAADAPHYWTGITFFSGHPKDNASLAPDEAGIWSFSKNDTIYMGCSYHQSNQMLFKKLPKTLGTCAVIFDKTVQGSAGQPGIPQKIVCKG